MVLRKFYIRNDHDRFLRKLPGSMAEHIRTALDDYMEKKKRETFNVSTSKSKKGDD